MLSDIQLQSYQYFLNETNPANGLVRDRDVPGAPASIAGSGFALSCLPVAVSLGVMDRKEAAWRALMKLRFFRDSRQGPGPDTTGHRGFFYHFLEMSTGVRSGKCELSTMDTALLLAGALVAAAWFDGDSAEEREIRESADMLYRAADWDWARNGGVTISHGWKPERGFLRYRWEGYSEALLLYILALGSPTNPVPPESYAEFTRRYRWVRLYGTEYLHAGPLFIHQMPHVWLDLGGIQDRYMRGKGIDYFENSRRATLIQREYARRNPRGHANYTAKSWGITASDGPGPHTRREGGKIRRFYGYRARGVPWGIDDGTLSPWAVAASMPFAPDMVLEALTHRVSNSQESARESGHHRSFNHSFGTGNPSQCWVSGSRWAIDQGPVVLMLENYRTGLIWRLMRRSPNLVEGLRRAGFDGGWLST